MKYLREQQDEIASIIGKQNHRAYDNMQKLHNYDARDYDVVGEALEGIKNQLIALFAEDDSAFNAARFVDICRRRQKTKKQRTPQRYHTQDTYL